MVRTTMIDYINNIKTEELDMLNFINTSIVEEGKNIRVMFFSDNLAKTVEYMEMLSEGEVLLKKIKSPSEYQIEIEKDGHKISLHSHPLSTHARGHRTNYSFIDKNIFTHDRGDEIFKVSIEPKTVNYNVNGECGLEDTEIRLFLF